MPTPVRERTRSQDLVIEVLPTSTTTALTTTKTPAKAKSTNLGPLALLAAGVLGLATVVASTAEAAPEEPEPNLKLRQLTTREVESLPRFVTTEDHWPVHEATYFSVDFKRELNQPSLILALSKVKSDDHEMLYLHYPDSPIPNPLFEGALASFQALGDALRKRLELVPGLESTVGEVVELVEKLGELVPAHHKEILFAPVENYLVMAAPTGVNLHRATSKTAAFIVVGQNKYDAPICNDFPMIHCLEEPGKLALTWGNDETARTAEGELGSDRLVTLTNLIKKRIHEEWKSRYRITTEEAAQNLAAAIAQHIWTSIPNDWKLGASEDSISLPDSKLTFTMKKTSAVSEGGSHTTVYALNGRMPANTKGWPDRGDNLGIKYELGINNNPTLHASWNGTPDVSISSYTKGYFIDALIRRFTHGWYKSLQLTDRDAVSLANWIYGQYIKEFPNRQLAN